MRGRVRRAFVGTALASIALASVASARAADAPSTEACVAAHVAAQREQKAGKLGSARASAKTCAAPSCPDVIVSECSAIFSAVDKAMPSVVFKVKDEGGADVVAARVLDGGAPIADRLDGKAIELDPGEHRFSVEAPGLTLAPQVVLLREGERLRVVSFSAAAPRPEASRAPSPAFWALGAAGLAGLGLFAGLGGAGLAVRQGLEDQGCKPSCAEEDVDALRRLFLGADVSLGLGVASLAAATIVFFVVPGPSTEARASLRLGGAPGGAELSGQLAW